MTLAPHDGRAEKRWGRAVALVASLGAHLALLALVTLTATHPPPPPVPPAVAITLVSDPAPVPSPGPPGPAPGPRSQAPAASKAAKTRPVPPKRPSPKAAERDEEEPVAELSDAQVAGAARVGAGGGGGTGGGGGGGVCDMAARVQAALRRDPLVRAAAAGAGSRAALVWNGDWVRSRGEDGKGLAAVREAILWEIAFAPPACRSQSVRGLVLLSLTDSGGGARLVMGAAAWKWSDLLTPKAGNAR